MGYYCTVPQCTSLAGKTKNVKFHRFPRDVMLAETWNDILKRGKPYTKYSKVCSLHFTPADYNVTTMGQWKTLSKDAVPSQNLPKLHPDGTVMVIRKSRTVKYKESKREEQVISDKVEKWSNVSQTLPLTDGISQDQESGFQLAYRLQALNSIANNITPDLQHNMNVIKPEKQDAFMQTDPILSEEEENLNCSESEKSINTDIDYNHYKDTFESEIKYEIPKDFSKNPEDYLPQTNEEYNKEAEKYALERKSHGNYDKIDYKKIDYQKPVVETVFQKGHEMYYDKEFQQRTDFLYQIPYQDSVELLRNQQHNLQVLQEQHRINENQNFFNENHIKQEVDFSNDEDKYLYDRNKEPMDPNAYEHTQQVKQEPDIHSGCDNAMQPQGSPFYSTNGASNVTARAPRPGPELLIAKQNALAAHTQLWQNTMKRPFFYSESPHYNSNQVLHRYEDMSRILQ